MRDVLRALLCYWFVEIDNDWFQPCEVRGPIKERGLGAHTAQRNMSSGEATSDPSPKQMGRLWYRHPIIKAEVLRLICAFVWFVIAALSMALVQINGDSLHARHVRNSLVSVTTTVSLKNFNGIHDLSLQALPAIPKDSWFNPDFTLQTFFISSLIAALIHWTVLTFLARLRRFFWLYGACYFLRMCTLASTVLPPSNPLCIPKERSLSEMLLLAPRLLFGLDHTCTDKLFSGHTAVATLLLWFWWDARSKAGDSYYSFWRLYAVIHFGTIVISSLMGWNHYTVDIVLAFIILTLVYWTYMCVLSMAEHSWPFADRSGEDYPAKSTSENMDFIPKWLLSFIIWCDGTDLKYASSISHESVSADLNV